VEVSQSYFKFIRNYLIPILKNSTMISEEEDKKFVSFHADPDAWKGGKMPVCHSCLNEFWKDDRRYCDVCSPAEQDEAIRTDKCEYYLKQLCPR